jgi:hypothetical protein
MYHLEADCTGYDTNIMMHKGLSLKVQPPYQSCSLVNTICYMEGRAREKYILADLQKLVQKSDLFETETAILQSMS